MEELNWLNQKRMDDWDDLSFLQRETIVEELSNRFENDTAFCEQLTKAIEEDQDWWKNYQSWGIEIKAFIRNIIKDEELPLGDWDHYWVSALEQSIHRVNDRKEKNG